MKNIFGIIFTLIITLILSSCDTSVTGKKASAVGAPYEIIVVCGQDKWEGELGDTLRSVLLQPVEILNQTEPSYDVRRVLPNSFSGLLEKSRNVINVVSGDKYAEPAMLMQSDVYASPQLIVTISGPDNKSIVEFMSEHRAELHGIFQIAERERSLELNARYGDKKLQEKIFEEFGFNIEINKGYNVRNALENFMWISFEYPTASQGLIIYSYPYNGRENFTIDSLLHYRDQFVSLIPGENPGSHMITFREYLPQVNHIRINGRYWAEMRGFWDVKGDFMGGPFVNYSTLDVENRRVVSIDMYVYSPDKPKRNFMHQLENLMYSVSFPSDEDVRNE